MTQLKSLTFAALPKLTAADPVIHRRNKLIVRRQRRASSASCAGLQSRQLHADTGPAGGNQALVVDQPAGKTRQNWCQGRAPWPLRHLPDGRGRGAEGIVPRDSAADRGTTTTATTSACVRPPDDHAFKSN